MILLTLVWEDTPKLPLNPLNSKEIPKQKPLVKGPFGIFQVCEIFQRSLKPFCKDPGIFSLLSRAVIEKFLKIQMVVINQYAGLIKPLTVTKITSNKTSPEKKSHISGICSQLGDYISPTTY